MQGHDPHRRAGCFRLQSLLVHTPTPRSSSIALSQFRGCRSGVGSFGLISCSDWPFSADGIPVRVWTWPGNTAVLPELRDGSADAAEALARPGRYTIVDDHLKVKEVLLESTPGVRRVVCWNTAEAAKDKARRDDAITRAGDRVGRARRAECALREHRTLGRYLRQLTTGRLLIDHAAIAAEATLDGKYLLSTSDQHLTAVEVALSYKNLLGAERGFRDLKSTLLPRPVFHRLEHRLRAHVLICWLALLLIGVAEQRNEQTWNRISHEMDRQAHVTLTGLTGTVVHTTVPTPEQSAIYTACQATPPPRIITVSTPSRRRPWPAGRRRNPAPGPRLRLQPDLRAPRPARRPRRQEEAPRHRHHRWHGTHPRPALAGGTHQLLVHQLRPTTMQHRPPPRPTPRPNRPRRHPHHHRQTRHLGKTMEPVAHLSARALKPGPGTRTSKAPSAPPRCPQPEARTPTCRPNTGESPPAAAR
mgnify:CR=1 FL=1